MVASQEQVSLVSGGGVRTYTVDGATEARERNLNFGMPHGFTHISGTHIPLSQSGTMDTQSSGQRQNENMATVRHSVTNFLTSNTTATKPDRNMSTSKLVSSMHGYVSPTQLTMKNNNLKPDSIPWPSSLVMTPERDVYSSSASSSPTLLSPMSFGSNMTMSSPPESLPFLSPTLSPVMQAMSSAPSIFTPTVYQSPLSSPVCNTTETPVCSNTLFGDSQNLLTMKSGHTNTETSSKATKTIKNLTETPVAGKSDESKKNGEDKENRKRSKRTNFTTEQIARLQSLFDKEAYPESVAMENLANELNLSEKQIKIWFQNKRARSRRRGGSVQKLCPISNHTTAMPRIYSPMTSLGYAKPVDFSGMPTPPMGYHPLGFPFPTIRNDMVIGNTTEGDFSQMKMKSVSPNSSVDTSSSWRPFWAAMTPYGTGSFNHTLDNRSSRLPMNMHRASETGSWNGNVLF